MKKIISIYLFANVIVLSGLSLVQKADLSKADILYYAALFFAGFLGVTHVIMMNKLRLPQASRPFGFRFRLTIFILLVSAIASFVLYRFFKLDPGFLTFIIPFILPYILWQCFIIFSTRRTNMN